jgi:hypothetical protein
VVTKPSNDARTKTFTDLRRKKLRRGETRKKRARVMDRRRELASYRSKRNQGESLMEKDLETLKMVLGAFFPFLRVSIHQKKKTRLVCRMVNDYLPYIELDNFAFYYDFNM